MGARKLKSKYITDWDALDNKKYPPNISRRILIVSVVFALYLLIFREYIAGMFDPWEWVYSVGLALNQQSAFIWFLLTTPVFIAYAIYIFVRFARIKYMKKYIYPLIAFNLLFGFAWCCILFPDLAIGNAYAWLFAYLHIPVVLVCFIVGLVKDIRYANEKNKL